MSWRVRAHTTTRRGVATRALAGLGVVAALAALTACQARTVEPHSGLDPGLDEVASDAPAPEAVPESEVIAAVRKAATLDELPPSIDNAALLAASGDDQSAWAVPGCTPGWETTSLTDLGPCTMGDVDADRTLMVIGDSGAAMWHGAFDAIGKRKGWQVISLTKNSCGPADLLYYQWQLKRDFPECNEWQDWQADLIQELKPDVVVMAGWFGGNLGPDRPLDAEIWRDGLVKTAKRLPPSTRIVMLANQPHPTDVPAECVASHPDSLTKCALPADEAVPDQSGWKNAAKDVDGTFIDVTPWFCTDACPAVIADQIVYAGSGHITVGYGRYVSGALQAALAPALRG